MPRVDLPTLTVVALVMALFGACAPRLEIRHEDPAHDAAAVWIDGEHVDTLEYGDRSRFRLREGLHRVRVVPPDQDWSPWHADHRELDVVLDEGAVMTLLPGPPKASKEDRR